MNARRRKKAWKNRMYFWTLSWRERREVAKMRAPGYLILTSDIPEEDIQKFKEQWRQAVGT